MAPGGGPLISPPRLRPYRVFTRSDLTAWTTAKVTASVGVGGNGAYTVPTSARRRFTKMEAGRGINPWP